jgi:predicted house-cleaning noncanonical NTP pyrophosphatase (MazG superfamily)
VADDTGDTPQYQEIPEAERVKAKKFFDRGNTVAATGNYEYAIEMYLSGLAVDPDAVEAHETLRTFSMKRMATGGKKMGMMDAFKLGRPSKDDKQNLLNQEKLLAYEPGNTDHMVGVLQNALRGGYFDTVLWIGPILQKANADSLKPDVKKFIVLRDAYKALKRWKLAADACQFACLLRPDDMDLQNEYRHIAAQQTITEGSYDQSGGFRKSQKDAEGQDLRGKIDSQVQTKDMMSSVIAAAKAEWKADPNEPGKINKYADALAKTEQPELENQAIELLQQAYERSKQYRFRLRVGQIRMSQMNRMERTLRANVNSHPNDPEALQSYKQFVQEKLQEELAEFQLALENYPTQANYRMEVASRLVQLRRFDEAIPVLQQLRNDPKYKHDAGGLLGRAFLESGYVDEAIDTLAATINDYPVKGDAKSTDMTYIYGRALEQKGEKLAAQKAYSMVAQANFSYKDVQARIKKLREDTKNLPPAT